MNSSEIFMPGYRNASPEVVFLNLKDHDFWPGY
jgi:hypothetical protein